MAPPHRRQALGRGAAMPASWPTPWPPLSVGHVPHCHDMSFTCLHPSLLTTSHSCPHGPFITWWTSSTSGAPRGQAWTNVPPRQTGVGRTKPLNTFWTVQPTTFGATHTLPLLDGFARLDSYVVHAFVTFTYCPIPVPVVAFRYVVPAAHLHSGRAARYRSATPHPPTLPHWVAIYPGLYNTLRSPHTRHAGYGTRTTPAHA